VERGSGETLWRQIARALDQDIRARRLQPGDRLPTEAQLATRFAVNRHTVRRALRTLAESGLVRVEQGRGTFVQERVLDYPLGPRTRFSQIVLASDRLPGHQMLGSAVVKADRRVAKNLGLRPGARVIALETLSFIDGRPSGIGTHYFPAARFDGLIDAYQETGSVTQALARCGVADYRRAVTRIGAVMPSAADAHHLRCARNRPLLETESVNVDGDGKPIEFGLARFVSDRVQLVVQSEAQDGA
jgi:GntR family phosphonate transport system transcriptional regulator